MSVQLASQIWNLVRDAIDPEDIQPLADSLVGILVEQEFDLDDIRYEFRGDNEVEQAIKFYADEDDEWEESYEDEDLRSLDNLDDWE